MPKFVVERNIPKAGSLSPEQLQEISQRSCAVLRGMGTQTQWVQSYVTEDKIYCIYVAPDEDALREHAQQGAPVGVPGQAEGAGEDGGQAPCGGGQGLGAGLVVRVAHERRGGDDGGQWFCGHPSGVRAQATARNRYLPGPRWRSAGERPGASTSRRAIHP